MDKLYESLLAELKSNSEEEYAAFHARLLHNDKIKVLGVRTATLHKIARKYKPNLRELLACPDEYYDVTFIKLSAAMLLDFEEFIKVSDYCVSLIDNWATCDSFKPRCVASHKAEYLPFVKAYMGVNEEFYQRFALVTLLNFYMEESFFPTIFEAVKAANTNYYYVHMAAAWIVAETLVKYFDEGVRFLKLNSLDKKTHNKAIQKAKESFRLSDERKQFLNGLKRRDK